MGTWPNNMSIVVDLIENNSVYINDDIELVYRRVKNEVIQDSDFNSHVENGRKASRKNKEYEFNACSVFRDEEGLSDCENANPNLKRKYPYIAMGVVLKDSGKIGVEEGSRHINRYIYNEYKDKIKGRYKCVK